MNPGNGGQATVTVMFDTPQLSGRAYADGNSANTLYYAVYEVKNDGSVELTPIKDVEDGFKISKKLELQLVNGHTYGFAVVALNNQAPYTVTFAQNGATMSINDNAELKANDETLDAFYAYEKITVDGSKTVKVSLYRPFAQINIGANDMEAAAKMNVVPTKSQIVVADTYTSFDLLTGTVDYETKKATTYAYNAIPEKEPYPGGKSEYLAMAYALVPEFQQITTVEFSWNDSKGALLTRKIGSVPVQRNYRTNIYGDILTTKTDVTVEIEPDFKNPDYDIENAIWPGVVYDEATKTYTVYGEEGLFNVVEHLYNNPEFKTLSGTTVKLASDMDLRDRTWEPINNKGGVFDGDRHCILGMKVDKTADGNASAGFFSSAIGTVKNITFVACEVKGNFKAGIVAGDGLCAHFDNIIVQASTVVSTPWKKDGSKYDDGNNAGAVVGYLSAEPGASLNNIWVFESHVTAYRKVGGAVGYLNGDKSGNRPTVTNVHISNTVVTADMSEMNYDGYPRQAEAGEIYGGAASGFELGSGCTTDNVTVNILKNVASDSDALNNILKNSTENEIEVTLKAGEYSNISFPQNKQITINGAGPDTKLNIGAAYANGSEVELNDLTLAVAETTEKGFCHAKSVVYNNVTIKGYLQTYASEIEEFNGCTFEPLNSSKTNTYLVGVYGAPGNVSFNNCHFYNYTAKGILVYNGGTVNLNVLVENCDFNELGGGMTSTDKAAVEVHTEQYSAGSTGTIKINKTTYPNAFGSGLWREWHNTGTEHATEYFTFIVDGATKQTGTGK